MTAAHCEVKLHGFRRTQDGVVVSFVVHPSEVPQCLALDPLGQRYMIGIAAIGDDEQPTAAATQQPSPSSTERLSKRGDDEGNARPELAMPARNRGALPSATARPGRRYAVLEGIMETGPERAASAARRATATTNLPLAIEQEKANAAAIVQRAGILAADKRFWAWINVADAEAAAAFIRLACAVESRRDLATNTGAAIRFQGLLDEFEASTGRRAEMRS